ncbi:MAG: hypothetical protein E6K99_04110 [Thaumarchaeota archaeon]|nr:MAG: hypothetical protein E6K99_04110 [Nitrososphaerota archaeon]
MAREGEGRAGEGREGDEEGRDGDFEYFRKLKERRREIQGEKEESRETIPLEQEAPDGRPEAGNEEGRSDEFESYVRHLQEKYGAEPGEADDDERQAPEIPEEHDGRAKTRSEAWVMDPPGEGDWWEDTLGSSNEAEGVRDAKEARDEDGKEPRDDVWLDSEARPENMKPEDQNYADKEPDITRRDEGLGSKKRGSEISSNIDSSIESDFSLTDTNESTDQDRRIDASESKPENRVRDELEHIREKINEQHFSVSEVADRSEVLRDPIAGEPISEMTTRLDAKPSPPENPSGGGNYHERFEDERERVTRPEFGARIHSAHEGKQRETLHQEALVGPREGSGTEAPESRSIVSTLRGEGSTNPRFFIAKRLIEEATGVELENGKEYELRGRIEGIGDFKMRHVERGEPHVYVHVPKEEQSDKMKFGEKYVIEFDSVRERREYNVLGTVVGSTVKVPGASVERMGFRDVKSPSERTVVDFRVSNLSTPNEPARRYFATYNPKADELQLRVRRGGASPGDVLRVEQVKEYGKGDFVRDFEAHKGDALKNVELRLEKGGLLMEVDRRRFSLNEPRIDTFGLKATLSAKLESSGKFIRFQFDGEKVSPKLFRDSRIISFESEHGLAIKYDKGGNEIRTFRLFDKFDGKILLGKLRLMSSPREEDGEYLAEADSWLEGHVRARFSNINGKERLSREKGDISEEIARHILSMTKPWEEIADHPYPLIRAEGSRRRGPDSLQRLTSSGELYYFEFKWWGVMELARSEARSEALDHLLNHPTYKGENVVGAYIGILEWNVRSKDIRLYVERVWPEI